MVASEAGPKSALSADGDAAAFVDPTAAPVESSEAGCEIVIKRSLEEVLAVLFDEKDDRPWDCIISNYGWRGVDAETSSAQVVRELHARLPPRKWCPVIAYGTASGGPAMVEVNRRRAIRDGCFDYCVSTHGLISRLERLFNYDPATDTW